jgi:phosphoenolpyruvate synthase/pyruvate phosphate dikinase
MPMILDTLLPIGILATLSVFPVFTVAALVFHSLRKKELEVRRLEALAQVATAVRHTELPTWLDQEDTEDVTEWKEAKREVERLAVRSTATAQHAMT